MMESSDVVIIGGGVAGCAAAYYLALAGVKATIIEREGIGSQASGFPLAALIPWREPTSPARLAPWLWSLTGCTGILAPAQGRYRYRFSGTYACLNQGGF